MNTNKNIIDKTTPEKFVLLEEVLVVSFWDMKRKEKKFDIDKKDTNKYLISRRSEEDEMNQ
jgi:hypothetical protein